MPEPRAETPEPQLPALELDSSVEVLSAHLGVALVRHMGTDDYGTIAGAPYNPGEDYFHMFNVHKQVDGDGHVTGYMMFQYGRRLPGGLLWRPGEGVARVTEAPGGERTETPVEQKELWTLASDIVGGRRFDPSREVVLGRNKIAKKRSLRRLALAAIDVAYQWSD